MTLDPEIEKLKINRFLIESVRKRGFSFRSLTVTAHIGDSVFRFTESGRAKTRPYVSSV